MPGLVPSRFLRFVTITVFTFISSGEQLLDHKTETGHTWTEMLAQEEEGERARQGELLDFLRIQRAEGSLPFGCQGCLRHGEGLQRHLEKHLEGEKARKKIRGAGKEKRKISEDQDDTDSRLTRRMKKNRLSLDGMSEEQSSDALKEGGPSMASPPLRLKIKLTPEIAKSLDSAMELPNKTPAVGAKPSVAVRPMLVPLVESLGVDVPTPRALALLNKLPHAMDAFSRGSVPRRQPSKPGYSCAICGHKEVDRGVFQEHIVKHAREGCAQCKECGASFAVEPSWRKHLLLIHGVKLPGLEDLCQDLVPHRGSISEIEDLSEEDFAEEEEEEEELGALVIDTGEEEEEGSLVCAGCEERFSSQTGLEAHQCGPR